MDYKNEFNSDEDFESSIGYSELFNSNSNYNNNSSSSYNSNNGQSSFNNQHELSKAELRKTNKPIMEKKRRARINNCLNELKSLILEAMKKDPARHTKLEKADILEMTVKHLQSVQRQRLHTALETNPAVIHKFKNGFVECAEQVKLYINQLDNVDAAVRQQLHNHLNTCAANLEQLGSMTNFNNGYRGQLAASMNGAIATAASIFGATLPNPLAATLPNPLMTTAAQVGVNNAIYPTLATQDLNGNNQIGMQTPIAPMPMGVQLIPSRLATGELALIMPNQMTAAPATAAAALTATATHAHNALPNTTFPVWPHAATTTAAAAAAAVTSQQYIGVNANAVTTPAANQINDFTANFKHFKHSMSAAFSKPLSQQTQQQPQHPHKQKQQQQQAAAPRANTFQPQQQAQHQPPSNNLHHNTTATTSPPLSPVSSVSSHGDDSAMHTSSDFANSCPNTPPQQNANNNYQSANQHNFSGVFSTPPSAESSLSTSPPAISSTPLSTAGAHLQQQQVSSTSDSAIDLNASSPTFVNRKRPLNEAAHSNHTSSEEQQLSKKSLQMNVENQPQEQLNKPFVENLGNNVEDSDNVWRPW